MPREGPKTEKQQDVRTSYLPYLDLSIVMKVVVDFFRYRPTDPGNNL